MTRRQHVLCTESHRRIVGYDGKFVTISYRDYRDNQDKTLTLTASKFALEALLEHIEDAQRRYEKKGKAPPMLARRQLSLSV